MNSKSLSFLVGQDWCKAYCPDSPKDSWHSIKYCSQISYQWIEQIFKHTLSCVGYWKRLESWANIFFLVFSRRQTETKDMCTVIFFSFAILFMKYFYNFSLSRYRTWIRQRILVIIMLPFLDLNILFVSTLFHFLNYSLLQNSLAT